MTGGASVWDGGLWMMDDGAISTDAALSVAGPWTRISGPPSGATVPALRAASSSAVNLPWAAPMRGLIWSRILRAFGRRLREGSFSVCTAVRMWQTQVGP